MRRRDQRGMSNSVQVVVLLPLAFGLFLTLLQWSLNSWAEATALAAAQHAATTSAALGAGEDDGRAAGDDVADNGALRDVVVQVRRGPRETTATVTGRAVTAVWPSTISRTVVVKTERLTAP